MNACDPYIQRLVPALFLTSMIAATMIAGLVIWGGICLVRRLFGPDEADTLTLWEVPPGTPPGAVVHLQPGVRLKWPRGTSYDAVMKPKPPAPKVNDPESPTCPGCRAVGRGFRLPDAVYPGAWECSECGFVWGDDRCPICGAHDPLTATSPDSSRTQCFCRECRTGWAA